MDRIFIPAYCFALFHEQDLRWQVVARIKRGLDDQTRPGGFGRDQAYFEGAALILRNLDSNNPPEQWEPAFEKAKAEAAAAAEAADDAEDASDGDEESDGDGDGEEADGEEGEEGTKAAPCTPKKKGAGATKANASRSSPATPSSSSSSSSSL